MTREISQIEVKGRRPCRFRAVTSRIGGRSEIQDSHSLISLVSGPWRVSFALCSLSLLLAVLNSIAYIPLLSLPWSSLSFFFFCFLTSPGWTRELPLCPSEVLFSSLACNCLFNCIPPTPTSLGCEPARAAPRMGIKVCGVPSTCQTLCQTCPIHYLNKSLHSALWGGFYYLYFMDG